MKRPRCKKLLDGRNTKKENTMKKRSANLLLIILVLVFVSAACTSFVPNSYKTLFVAGTAYDTAMKSVSSLQKTGTITEAQRAEINKYANAYYVSYLASVDALSAYNKENSSANKTKLTTAISTMSAAWAQFASNANRIAPALGIQPQEVQ